MSPKVSVAAVFTHRRPDETRPAIEVLAQAARAAGAVLSFSPDETAKLGLQPEPGF